jgi:hypothetical protein
VHGRITGPAKNKAIEENAARQEIMDHLVFNRSGRQMKGGVPQVIRLKIRVHNNCFYGAHGTTSLTLMI